MFKFGGKNEELLATVDKQKEQIQRYEARLRGLAFHHQSFLQCASVFFNWGSAEPHVPRVTSRGSAKTDRNCLRQNSQPQFYAVVAI